MKREVLLVTFLGSALLITACKTTSTVPTGDVQGDSSSSVTVMEESSSSSVDAMTDGESSDDSSSAAMQIASSAASVESTGRTIEITTDNFQFTPNVITVKKGEKITLRLTGIAGTHGFAVADLGINTTVAAGKTVDVDLPTDTAGTFSFRCSIPCGPGHKDMTGTITISE